MANKVTIDVEARFIDNVSGEAGAASSAFKKVETTARSAAKEVDNLGKKAATPKLDANTDKFKKAISDSDKKLAKFGKTKAEAKLSAEDKATSVVTRVLNKLKAFGKNPKAAILSAKDYATAKISKAIQTARNFAGKTYSAMLKIRDSQALASIRKVTSGAEKFVGKTWTALVKIKDMATAPLRGIKNMLFSIKSLVLAITAGLAAKQLIVNPINLADQYSSAKIGFSTLMGETAGQKMMDDLDAFAKKTPFQTSGVISAAQKMMAMGWDPENIIGDLEVLGNAAAATGNLNQGLESIVRAMSQIKTKGRLSTEELNQLAEAGIAAKAMLAEQLGYGTGDAGIAAMTEDLEKGAIASDKAIAALMAGMQKYNGMMDSMANETVEGLWSQIQDTFEINVFRKWGQGLQNGAKKGFGTILQLLEESEGALSKFGDMLYEIGEKASNWLADKFQNAVDRILKITDTFEFQNASLGEKISMLWNGVIVDPLKEWWEGGGQQKTAETAGKVGKWIGEMLTKGLLALLGITDIFAPLEEGGKSEQAGMSIAQSFAKGFTESFDVSAITDKLVEAISNVWGALPTWAKILIGGYAVGKAAGGIGSFIGGVANFTGQVGSIIGHGASVDGSGNAIPASGLIGLIGKTGSYAGGGYGLLGGLSTLGYGAVGKLSGAGAMAMGGLSGGLAAGAGLGLITAGAGAMYAGNQFYNAYQGYKEGDKTRAQASFARGAGTTAGIGVGALAGAKIGAGVGTIAGPVGTAVGGLIGAGVGTLVGWFAGDTIAKNIEAAKYESEEMKAAIKDSDASAEELAKTFEKAKWENAKSHFGDIELSMEEISRLANQIVWGDKMDTFDKLNSAARQAQASLQSLNEAGEQTDRWLWKAGLGVKFNEDEVESIKASFDNYINSAKSYVENKQYEFTASVEMLVDIESGDGKKIIESGNAYYAKIQEKLDTLGAELDDELEIALEDGVITLDEQKEIINIQKQIQAITEKIANSEYEAELDLIKLKFGNGNLSIETFGAFMDTMNTTVQQRIDAADTSFIKSVSTLKLELADGAITQEEYDAQLKALMEGYKAEIDSIKVEVMEVELGIIGEAYADELGADAADDLRNALEHCLKEDIDPINLTDEDLAKLINVDPDKLSGETAANIKEMLSGVFGQMELMEVDGNLLLKLGEVTTEEGTEEKVKEAVDSQVPDQVDDTVTVNVTGEKIIETMDQVLPEDFNIPDSIDKDVLVKLNAAKTVQEQVDILSSEFGISEEQAETILWKLTGSKSIMNRISVSADDFGIPDSVNKTVDVNITALPHYTTGTGGYTTDGLTDGPHRNFRGGIVGGASAMGSYARGGLAGRIKGFSDGGMVRGGSQLIEVAEEGSPEMVIPLSSQRRGRALKLWAQAGNIMGVPGFARGGVIGGNGGADEGIRFNTYGGDDSAGGQSVQIEVGGITVEIHVNTGSSENIAEAIKAQANEIAETVAGIMADAMGAQFENTATRGGVA